MTRKESDKSTWLVYLLIDFISNIFKNLLTAQKLRLPFLPCEKIFTYLAHYASQTQLCELEWDSDVLYK